MAARRRVEAIFNNFSRPLIVPQLVRTGKPNRVPLRQRSLEIRPWRSSSRWFQTDQLGMHQGMTTDAARLMIAAASSGSRKPSATRLLAALVTAATYPAVL